MFKRSISILKEAQLRENYSQYLNIENFETVSWWQLRKFNKSINRIDRDLYIHLLLSEWVDNQDKFDEEKLEKLMKLIKKYKVELDIIEQEELLLLEERVFAIDRVIKYLNVSFPLLNKEEVNARLNKGVIFKKSKDRLNIIDKGELIISNQRIIILSENNKYYLFDDIKWFNTKKYGFEFGIGSSTYVLRSTDQETLNNTLINFFKKKKPEFLTKRVS